ncbi:hypothetical protein SDC9_212587 [bioreactor metagenome]|uniref:Uncharacterized protein n=1 Tax=bioreactor metagenome TaxID=1076179 RepID=A0A645JP07_9ZZZZ
MDGDGDAESPSCAVADGFLPPSVALCAAGAFAAGDVGVVAAEDDCADACARGRCGDGVGQGEAAGQREAGQHRGRLLWDRHASVVLSWGHTE